MKEKTKRIILALLFSIAVAVLIWMMLESYKLAKPDPKPMQVTDKYEVKGKCYLQTWIEVSPEEYIGLDIGDEYEEEK